MVMGLEKEDIVRYGVEMSSILSLHYNITLYMHRRLTYNKTV
jgi:hypothetical protein